MQLLPVLVWALGAQLGTSSRLLFLGIPDGGAQSESSGLGSGDLALEKRGRGRAAGSLGLAPPPRPPGSLL